MKRSAMKVSRWMGLAFLTLALSLAWMAAASAEDLRPDLPGLSPQQKIDFIMGQMAKAQKQARTITAQFSMEKKMSLLAAPARADGILYVTKPDKIYWEVKAPIANTLIVNGKTLWMYYPTLRQVDKVDLSGKQRKVMQYLEMSEEGSVIKENYRIRLLENSNEKGVFVLELLPRTSRIGKRIAKIRVWVDSQTWFLSRIDLWEPNGDYSIIRLKDAKVNVPIQDSVYDFKPPPGTAINEPLKVSPPRSER